MGGGGGGGGGEREREREESARHSLPSPSSPAANRRTEPTTPPHSVILAPCSCSYDFSLFVVQKCFPPEKWKTLVSVGCVLESQQFH